MTGIVSVALFVILEARMIMTAVATAPASWEVVQPRCRDVCISTQTDATIRNNSGRMRNFCFDLFNVSIGKGQKGPDPTEYNIA